MRLKIRLILLMLLTLPFMTIAKQTVLFVNPSVVDDPFWSKVQSISQHAAQQLGFKLDVIYGEGNRHIQFQELKKYLEYQKTPDYAILILYPGAAVESLKILEKFEVPAITMEQTISGEEKSQIAGPGEDYKYWLGEVYHDNYQAGYDLAKALHSVSNKKSNLTAVLINGHYGSESDMRAKGAADYFSSQGIEVAQEVHGSWSETLSTEQTLKLLKRHANIDIVWAASDLMAIGAMKACKIACADKQNIVFGGFDWLSVGLENVARGDTHASVGGHFMMGAWALVSLFDYHHKHSYWSEHRELVIPMGVITKQNVNNYSWMKNSPNWGLIDYRLKSLHLTDQSQYQLYLIPEIWQKNKR
ncbi:ABC transporter substrate-binding protein [Pseudoalteromonas phenolica]|uniref:Sugar ABC transporter substrate-binding protein n=1 Tax=Pseudoalteromonas phenolica TaxID=161398 RepID=A0A0S2K8M9_9GAMM|nr:ABC transporter substrate-binding protein [Pseudoalteromonas phenolica]ALO44637.1 Sugar ABC transporter substrate-binding protein [Pseudoalteromonas phenolica]MBE0357671.1 hypothetical protein [Pseudoalteromonas phenolica O-BC30]TMO55676.1 sugar ABC transporter substrate-binding protein [Pseudoalteromonas phenolica]